jgi:peptidoglycan/LPS O-acetylase OafA/YrhL
MTNNKNYYYELDILRGLACIMVFFSHCPIYSLMGSESLFFCDGSNGVYIFFIISGFIISKSFGHQVEKIDNFTANDWLDGVQSNLNLIYSFWYRRFVRLFPTLFLLFIVLIIITIDYGIKNGQLIECLIKLFRLIANFFLLDNSMNDDLSHAIDQFMYFKVGVMWSLDCEILFYIIFPLFVIFRKLFKVLPLIFIIIFMIKSILYSFVDFKYLYYGLLSNFDFFILGILIGHHHHHKIYINKNIITFFTVICLCTIIISALDAETYRAYLNGLISSVWLVYIASLQKNILNFPILGRFFHFVGIRSYFIYLMHVILKYILQNPFDYLLYNLLPQYIKIFKVLATEAKSEMLDHISNIILFFVVIIIADLFYKFVEQPFIQKYKYR